MKNIPNNISLAVILLQSLKYVNYFSVCILYNLLLRLLVFNNVETCQPPLDMHYKLIALKYVRFQHSAFVTIYIWMLYFIIFHQSMMESGRPCEKHPTLWQSWLCNVKCTIITPAPGGHLRDVPWADTTIYQTTVLYVNINRLSMLESYVYVSFGWIIIKLFEENQCVFYLCLRLYMYSIGIFMIIQNDKFDLEFPNHYIV